MASANMPDEFFEIAAHHLPPERPAGPRGGRPRVGHKAALRAIWFVLATGCRWEDVPREFGCSGRTANRRLRAWEACGAWDRVHADLLRLLNAAGKLHAELVVVDSVIVRAFGGVAGAGPSPVDRRKPGLKHTLMVDRTGVPLAVRTAGANASDHAQLFPLVAAYPRVGGRRGRPRELPAEVYADRGFGSAAARALLRWLGVEPRIPLQRDPHGSGLGRVRWVVERTVSWLKGLRRLRVRYDRSAVVRDAFTTLAAAVICFRILHHDTP